MRRSVVVLTLLGGAILLSPPIYADDSDARVARVSYVGGDVSYQRGDVEGWNDLRTNTPLVTGDSLYAPDGGRAEVDLGSGVVIRLDGGTQVELINNSSEVAQLGMSSGFLDIRARSLPRGFTLEIDTPSGAVTILEPGRYRMGVTDRAATYSVVQGSMSLALDGEQLDVREGESLELDNSDSDSPSYAYGSLGGRSPFRSWCDDRDSRYERSASARYVNRDVVGYEDLDDHGSWRDSRGYGQVWVPSGMSPGWAPYQSGRWIWQDPYGWTWVSYEPWGWAPYHYGRWVWVSNYWGWVPPPPRGYRGPPVVMDIQPVYAPALVAFVGGRNWGVSLSIGGPAIGWVPLAPAERYYYPWQPAPRVTNNYTNITVINAVTIVNYNTFATETVRPIRVPRAQIEQAPVIGLTAVGVAPTRGSLVVSPGRNAGSNAIPRPRPERPMVARLVPPPKPQPFTQKVVEIERTGRPVASPVVSEAAVGKPFAPGAQAPTGVKPFSSRGPGGGRELKARSSAETRAPRKFERDIAPPPPAVAPAPVTQPGAPPPVQRDATRASANGQKPRPQAEPAPKSNDMDAVAAAPTAQRTPQPAPQSPAEPTARKEQPTGNGQANRPQTQPRPKPKDAPATPPATPQAVQPAPQSPEQPAAGTAQPSNKPPATPPQPVPKKKKAKGKKTPEPPPPEPPPAPPPEDGN